MSSPDQLHARLEALLGPSGVQVDATETADYAIGPSVPKVVARPASVEQTAEVLRLAGREAWTVVPWGQGTQMHLGGIPTGYDIALSLSGLNRMVEYDVANLTVIAEAGMPLREVYRQSLPERQFLPLGFPGSRASLGGLLVTNTSGVKRARYGGMRDLLLGVEVGLPEGARVRFGGRVVKNVAGYDMNKLFIGSLGTFGVILETTYRLAALPEDDRLLAVVFPEASQAAAAAASLQAAPLQPSALLLTSVAAANASALPFEVAGDQVVLLLNVDGPHEAVERQLRDAQAVCEPHGGQEHTVLTGEVLLSVWEAYERWHSTFAHLESVSLQVQLGGLPSHLGTAIQALTAPQSFGLGQVGWWADYAHGQIHARISLRAAELSTQADAVRMWLADLRAQTRTWHGYCNLTAAPGELRAQLEMWDEAPGSALLQLYKQKFDPQAILNPGRYVAGI